MEDNIIRPTKYIKLYLIFSIILIIIVLLLIIYFYTHNYNNKGVQSVFERFNNESGSVNGCYIVPNFIHFIRFNRPNLSFTEAVCILAAFKHQKPEKIFIHTNTPVNAKNKYWKIILNTRGFKEIIIINNISLPKSIFGQSISSTWAVYHGGDIARLKILMEYGGIYLDNDSYVIRSLNDFRRYEISLGWRPGKSLQNQVIVANKDARFLKLWLESYRNNYVASKWYYNAGEYPTKILEQKPYLIHRVEQLFGEYGVVKKVFETKWPEWRDYYAVHLMISHQYLLRNVSKTATYPVIFNENNIKLYPIAFRDMVYEVYPYDKAL